MPKRTYRRGESPVATAISNSADPLVGPKSLCECGHTGDGPNSEHDHSGWADGHGPCRLCDCGKFTWDRFIKAAR